jgi:hypothetical protein
VEGLVEGDGRETFEGGTATAKRRKEMDEWATVVAGETQTESRKKQDPEAYHWPGYDAGS